MESDIKDQLISQDLVRQGHRRREGLGRGHQDVLQRAPHQYQQPESRNVRHILISVCSPTRPGLQVACPTRRPRRRRTSCTTRSRPARASRPSPRSTPRIPARPARAGSFTSARARRSRRSSRPRSCSATERSPGRSSAVRLPPDRADLERDARAHDAAQASGGVDPPAAPPVEEAAEDRGLGQQMKKDFDGRMRRASSRPRPRRRRPRARRRSRPPPRPRPRPARALALAEALLDLQQLTERLRRDCPWDREQTERTIVPHTVEEAYEVADAALAEDDAKLVDELGDLLFQVVLPLAAAVREGQGRPGAVARGIHEKLVRRHPHVFGDVEAETPARARRAGSRSSASRSRAKACSTTCPRAAGAALCAEGPASCSGRRIRVPATSTGALADLRRRAQGVARGARRSRPTRQAEEVGDLLFAAVNVARRLGADPELELRRASQRFRRAGRGRGAARRSRRRRRSPSSSWTSRTGTSISQRSSNERCRISRRPRPPDPRLAREPDGGSRCHASRPARSGGRRSPRAHPPANTRRSSCATAATPWLGKGVSEAVGNVRRELAERPRGMDADDQRGLDARADRARRHAEQVPARRERDPRRLARRRAGGRGRRRRAALPLARRRAARTCCRCR